jgi:hypothetical protein
MSQDIQCPFCETEFQGIEWKEGTCPGCGKEYYWDEQELGDNWEDSWVFVDWIDIK